MNIGIITIKTSLRYDKIDVPIVLLHWPVVVIASTDSDTIVLSVRINKLTINIAITGPIDASAIRPNPSSWLFLPDLTAHIPSPKAIINGTDTAPVVTPIVSKDNGRKLLGANIHRTSAII